MALDLGGLPPDQYVHVVREDPANPDVLYAGLEQGVWYTLDRGAHWQNLRLNMPSVAVHDMRIQPQRHDLLIATHGRGFWILDDVGAISGLGKAAAAAVPTLFPFEPRTRGIDGGRRTMERTPTDAVCRPERMRVKTRRRARS